jgi:hypothetical protein
MGHRSDVIDQSAAGRDYPMSRYDNAVRITRQSAHEFRCLPNPKERSEFRRGDGGGGSQAAHSTCVHEFMSPSSAVVIGGTRLWLWRARDLYRALRVCARVNIR